MISTIVSLLLCFLMVVAAAVHVNDSFQIFFDPVGIILVFGGTAGVALVTFGPKEFLKLIKTSIRVLKQNTDDIQLLAREVVNLAKDTRCLISELNTRKDQVKNLFFRDGVALICDRVEEREIEKLMRDRIKVKQESDDSTANMLRTLAKYPPSLGIVGTVLGLIALMLQLGAPGGTDKMGPAMAIGLVATLYGLVFTNFFLQPLSENLQLKSHKDIRKRQMAMVGVLLIKQGKSPFLIQEAMNSLLPVSLRIDELGVGNQQRSEEAA